MTTTLPMSAEESIAFHPQEEIAEVLLRLAEEHGLPTEEDLDEEFAT